MEKAAALSSSSSSSSAFVSHSDLQLLSSSSRCGNGSRLRKQQQQQQRFVVTRATSAADSGGSNTTTRTRLAGSSAKVLRDIPGTYGLPILGSLRDRQDLFYGSPAPAFFEKRIKEHGSTVFRANMPPGPPFFPSSKVIVLLDQVSFATLFDSSKVSKKDVFTGTYIPSTSFTGGYRVLSYLDVDEPKHAQLKSFCFDLLRSNAKRWLPELHSAAAAAFDEWRDKEQPLKTLVDDLCLDFLCEAVLDRKSEVTPQEIRKWILPQIAPVVSQVLPVPSLIEDLLLHTFPLPSALVQGAYDKIVAFFRKGERAAQVAAKHGVGSDEAVHNLIFFICFNTWGGFIGLLPTVVRYIAGDPKLQAELRAEIRQAATPSEVLTMKSLEAMPLLKSTVYEVLRLSPPVRHQYARARKDFILESHDEAFQVRRGEMLYGYQPLVTQDPRVFKEAPSEFRPRRFMSPEAQQELLPHVLWSNGPETQRPGTDNKQCPGKDFVILVARAFIAELFLKYDSMQLIQQQQFVRFHKGSS